MNWHIREAVRRLEEGGIIAYPTETVYGLGCDPLNATAVLHLINLKQRRIEQGLILEIDSAEDDSRPHGCRSKRGAYGLARVQSRSLQCDAGAQGALRTLTVPTHPHSLQVVVPAVPGA